MADRNALFGGAGSDPRGAVGPSPRAFGRRDPDQFKDLGNDQILAVQKKDMEEQDKVLDLLGQSVSRTKQIAYAIGNETDEQLSLLEDIDAKTDKTSKKLRNAKRKVERVELNSSTKALWCVIIFLILALIAVVVLAIYF